MSVIKILRGLYPFKKVSGGINPGKHHMISECSLNFLKTMSNNQFGIRVKDNEATNISIGILSKFTKLRSLYLSCPNVSDISVLKELSNLENILIYDTPIKSLEMFKDNKKVKNLIIKRSGPRDLGPRLQDLGPLKNCSNLRSLRIEGNRYPLKQQVDVLKRALPNCEITIR